MRQTLMCRNSSATSTSSSAVACFDLVVPDLDLDAAVLRAARLRRVRRDRLLIAGPFVRDAFGRQAPACAAGARRPRRRARATSPSLSPNTAASAGDSGCVSAWPTRCSRTLRRSRMPSRILRSSATVLSGISATPTAKRIGGTRFASLTVSSCSAATSRTSRRSPACVSSRVGSCAHSVGLISPGKCRSTASPRGGSRKSCASAALATPHERGGKHSVRESVAAASFAIPPAPLARIGRLAAPPEHVGLDRELVGRAALGRLPGLFDPRRAALSSARRRAAGPRDRRDTTGAARPAPRAARRSAARGAAPTARASRSSPARTRRRRDRGR